MLVKIERVTPMAINAYLNFNGNCREAVEFYAKVFGVEANIMTFGETPPDPQFQMPEEVKNRVMHARLEINGSTLMFSDVFPGMPFTIGNNISLSYVSEDLDEVRALFDKLKEGGRVGMELQETFWSKCYGNLTDKFGVGWQLNFGNGGM
jgi:PhnB protein